MNNKEVITKASFLRPDAVIVSHNLLGRSETL